MKRRKKLQRKAPRPRQTAGEVTAPASNGDPLGDARIRALLERYCKLARVKQAARGADLMELSLPADERPFFRDRAELRVAFSLDALERDPDAEIGGVGSPFLSQLIEAIRARAARRSLGLIAPPPAPEGASDPKRVELTIPIKDGTVKRSTARLAVHPVGRLVARVVLRAGAGVEEAIVESDVFDLSTGTKVDADLAEAFVDLEAGRAQPAGASVVEDAAPVPARAPGDLVRLLVSHLQEKSAERVAVRRAAAEQGLAVELGRLDRYFESILKEQSDSDAIGAVTALAQRRRTEEIRRSQVKAVVHPLQLIEAAVLMQHAEWRVKTSHGRGATFSAQRALSGEAVWSIACPHCGRPPKALVICRHEHGACDACSSRCSVCVEDFCADHGIAECRVDGQPACSEHVHVCPSCRLEHCTAHEGVCSEGEGHPACSACLAACGSCGRLICNRHAEQSHAQAPKGSRRLCTACLRHCEGGLNEAVGMDEVAQCASCGKSVCTAHQGVCAVDEQVHCAPHLRRTDKSQRPVCGSHKAGCALEGVTAVFASDEVAECPVCGERVCADHRAACGHCGRQVCTADLEQRSGHCATCARLAATREPPAEVVTAARAATGGKPRATRALRLARDRSHVVVEVDLGLKRRLVFTLRHGDTVPESVVRHSFWKKRERPRKHVASP